MKKRFWIARDTSGELFAYSSEPQRLKFPEEDGQPIGCFTSGGAMLRLERDLYPEITYENSPVEIENNMDKITQIKFEKFLKDYLIPDE